MMWISTTNKTSRPPTVATVATSILLVLPLATAVGAHPSSGFVAAPNPNIDVLRGIGSGTTKVGVAPSSSWTSSRRRRRRHHHNCHHNHEMATSLSWHHQGKNSLRSHSSLLRYKRNKSSLSMVSSPCTINNNNIISSLSFSSTTPITAAAAAGITLLLSSVNGILFEKKNGSGGGGHVITLLTAAFLSNVSQYIARRRMKRSSIIPVNHFLYDWCWSVVLPASLVFALLASSTTTSSSELSVNNQDIVNTESLTATTPSSSSSSKSKTNNEIIQNTIFGMMLPFLAGSIGSILGCIASFHFIKMPYPREVSALLAGCLTASYIGGTVNFFATAQVVLNNKMDGVSTITDVGGGGDNTNNYNTIGSAFGSMAAADLVVMALYFAVLQTATRSKWLQQLFPSKRQQRRDNDGDGYDCDNYDDEMKLESSTTTLVTGSTNSIDRTGKTTTPSSQRQEQIPTPMSTSITAAILASSMALLSVKIATHLEQFVRSSFLPPPFNPPGTMCAFLALLGLMLARIIQFMIQLLQYRLPLPMSEEIVEQTKQSAFRAPTMVDSEDSPWSILKSTSTKLSSHILHSLQHIPRIAPMLSDACFYLLFASVGTTANLSSAIIGGPSALLFALLALGVHSVVTLFVTYGGMSLGRRGKEFARSDKCGGIAASSSSTYLGMILPRQLRQPLHSKTLNFPSSSWEEVLTASNAAIGGPSTAAAFAMGLASSSGRINNDDDKNNDIVGNCSRRREEQHRSALVIGATVWGVFGYAIATGAYRRDGFTVIDEIMLA
ncbi:hypothetical protein ACHAWU_003690 [Discostella pseudostelligera]|uniref:Uncharacterized protein n=1 Tax=Discostella pseudostelligera TaxID=259834 RepID=A0ABD3N5X4_9STRA